MTQAIRRILHLDASGRHGGSASRELSQQLVDRLTAGHPAAAVVRRDLAEGIPFVDQAWIAANNTPDSERTPAQHQALALSDALVHEMAAADVWVWGVPIYNFAMPAVLKAYIDQITRAGLTFTYGERGPLGLLADRNVYIVVASGGTPVGSDYDFLTGYLRHILGFIGVTAVEFIAADQLLRGGDRQLAAAREQIASIAG